jgi:catechol 2,3-dioxygenase-like lactoylglutathione lyase family enzyme
MMALIAIDHVQLAMPKGREAAAVEFYEGILGLTRMPKPSNLEVRGGCWFQDRDVKIHLGVDPEFVPARKAHPALVVTNLGDLVDKLRIAGVGVREAEPLTGCERVHVDDPFGNRIELMQLLG